MFHWTLEIYAISNISLFNYLLLLLLVVCPLGQKTGLTVKIYLFPFIWDTVGLYQQKSRRESYQIFSFFCLNGSITYFPVILGEII